MSNIGRITGVFNTPASGTTVITVDDAFAVHFWYSRVTADDTVQADQMFGHGFAAGGDRDCGMTAGEDGANQNQRDGRNVNWCLITDAAGTSDVVLGNVVTFNASNVTLSYTTFSANHRIHYEIWYGTDGSAEMREVVASTSPITDLTMSTPDMVFCWTLGQLHPASSIHAYQSFGVAVDNAGIDQWCQFTYMGDSDTDSVGSALVDGQMAGQYDVDFAAWQMQITAIGSNGCTWSGSNPDEIIFLFLDLAGDNVHVGTFAKSTASAPTTQQMPTFGFTPDGYGIATCNFDAQTLTTNRIVVNSFGAYDEETGVGHSALSVGTASSNADRASWSSPTEVLAGSTALQANAIQFSGTPDAITDATPSIEWNPNTTGGTDDVIIGVYGHEQQVVAPLTCSGDPLIPTITASGTASQILMPSGTPSIDSPTASGVVTQFKKANGVATLAVIVAAGVASLTPALVADGTPLIDSPTASGTVTQIYKPSGTPSIDSPTASGVVTQFLDATGTPIIDVVTASGVVNLAPKVWLNATAVLSGATEMTRTAFNLAGTSATFTDPIGAPTGALFLGVENRNLGGGDSNTGWIAVTVTAPPTADGTPLIDSPTASGVVNLAPRVYLNTSQTLSGATQMTLTASNLAGTSATFTDPIGAPTGALFLGVENRNLGGGDSNTRWIAVTVNDAPVANGTPLIDEITASGTATQIYKPSGTPSIDEITASGVVTQFLRADGTPLIDEITAAGVVTQIQKPSGTPSIDEITASGVAAVGIKTITGDPLIDVIVATGTATQIYMPSGTPSIDEVTASGTAAVGDKVINGNPLIDVITASGTVTQIQKPSGTPLIEEITASGVATQFLRANGNPLIDSPTASGTATQIYMPSGTPSIDSPTANGVVTQFKQVNGNPLIDEVTAAGVVTQIYMPSGTPSIDEITASGVAAVGTKTITGDPLIDEITASGSVIQIQFLNGTPLIEEITANGVVILEGEVSAFGNPLIDEITAAGTVTQIYMPSGTPAIDSPIAAGTAFLSPTAIGTPSIDSPTASGVVTQFKQADGTPLIDSPTASGTVTQIQKPSGTPLIDSPTASGTATQILMPSGTPSIGVITASGVASLLAPIANGTPLIDAVTAAGTVTQIQVCSGTPIIDEITASGVAGSLDPIASGDASIEIIIASGTATQILMPSGTPAIDSPTASGVVTQFLRANGNPLIDEVIAAGSVTQIQVCSGTPTIDVITASGVAFKAGGFKLDTFTVGSDTPLENHTSDIGGDWQGVDVAIFDIVAASDSIQLEPALTLNTVIGDENPSSADYFVEVEGTLGVLGGLNRVGVLLRATGGASQDIDATDFYVFRVRGNEGWSISRTIGGASNELASDNTWVADNSIADDDPIKVKATITGSGAVVFIKLELDFNLSGGGFSGYSTVSEFTDTHVNRITAANNAGLQMGTDQARETFFNAEFVQASPLAGGTPSIDTVTASGVASATGPVITASGNPLIDSPTASGIVNLAPRIYLNTSQTLSGATEMTRTANNLAGTSATFTDPSGAPIGSLFLGVENRNLGGGDSNTGWIAVTVNQSGAIGTPSIDSPTAVGVVNLAPIIAGTPSIDSPTANGLVNVFGGIEGFPTLDVITASGVVNLSPRIYLNTSQTLSGATQMTLTASNLAGTSATFTDPVGAPIGALFLGVENRNLGGGDSNTRWIAVTVNESGVIGTPSIDEITASGVVDLAPKAIGTPSIEIITASGAITQIQKPSGTPSINSPTAVGVINQIQEASGTPVIDVITASGVTAVGEKVITGTPAIDTITASGIAEVTTKVINGTPSIDEITVTAGAITQTQKPFGTPSIDEITAASVVLNNPFLEDLGTQAVVPFEERGSLVREEKRTSVFPSQRDGSIVPYENRKSTKPKWV